jgi:hypothetical protein
MANQPSPPQAQPPPDLPNMKDVSDTLSDYLRRFSLWCRHGFQAKLDANVAQIGLPLMGYDAPAGAAPKVYQFEVSNAGVAGLAPVPLAGTPGAFTPITAGFLPLGGGVVTGPITPAGGLVGVTDGSNAAAGQIGEVISSNVTTGVSLTTSGSAYNITSISLTPGDWDVRGEVWIVAGSGAPTVMSGAINSVSATVPTASALNASRVTLQTAFAASALQILSLRPTRISLSATTIIYLVAGCVFPSGTPTATGNIIARRAR